MSSNWMGLSHNCCLLCDLQRNKRQWSPSLTKIVEEVQGLEQTCDPLIRLVRSEF